MVPNESGLRVEPAVAPNPFRLNKPVATLQQDTTLLEQNVGNFGRVEEQNIPISSPPQAQESDRFVGSTSLLNPQPSYSGRPQAQESDRFVGRRPSSRVAGSGILGGGPKPVRTESPVRSTSQTSQLDSVSTAQVNPVENVTEASSDTPQATLQESPPKKVEVKVTTSIPSRNPLK